MCGYVSTYWYTYVDLLYLRVPTVDLYSSSHVQHVCSYPVGLNFQYKLDIYCTYTLRCIYYCSVPMLLAGRRWFNYLLHRYVCTYIRHVPPFPALFLHAIPFSLSRDL